MAVNITKRVKLDGKGWRFCPVTENARRVIVNGQKLDLDGRYYIDFLQDGERKRLAAGATPAEALAKAEQQKRLLAAQKAAAEAGIELPANVSALAKTEQEKLLAAQNAANAAGIDLPKAPIVSGRPLRETVAKYLDVEVKPHKKPKTYSAYRTALGYFLESCHKATLEEITRTDMLSYKTFLKRKGQTDRSAWNKFASVMSFLKRYEASLKLKLTSHDWPQYVEEDVEIYTQEQLDAFFGACAKMENLWFTFFLETGMREQEVTHAQWSWVNFERNVITIREVRRFDWQPKKNKGRQIPIPSTLTAALKKWHEKCDPTCGLIFPTAG